LTHEEVPLMRVQVLTVADCPNGPVLIERLADALADRPDVEVEHRVVMDAQEAARLGMHGSPTLLLDGRDPFTSPRNPTGLSCRLYRGADGHVEGAPSVRELRQVVRDHLAGDDSGGRMVPVLAVDRGGRGRLAPAERGLRAVQQAVLRAFAATGSPPPVVELQAAAGAWGVSAAEVVTELASDDFLCVDEEGRITVAYPFSTAPTEHLVEIGDGPRVWAMCAIDALGIPVMLGRDAVITSTDPASGQAIRVEFVNGRFLGAVLGGGVLRCARPGWACRGDLLWIPAVLHRSGHRHSVDPAGSRRQRTGVGSDARRATRRGHLRCAAQQPVASAGA
jgi:hypothetical protein